MPFDQSDVARLQRARGELVVRFRRREQATVLETLRQAGCLKARFPTPAARGEAELLTLNISGGLAAGDIVSTRVEAARDARVVFSSQAAERFYRALPGSPPSLVRNVAFVGPGASLEWLPQETILFDGCALDRVLDVEMTATGSFLGLESLVFGRTAMGETVGQASLRDLIRIRRDGRLLLHDAIRMAGAIQGRLNGPAIGGGARAVATLVNVAADAEARCDSLRAALAGVPAEWGVSAWDGLLVARFVAADGAKLRHAITRSLLCLRDQRPLPRVWMC